MEHAAILAERRSREMNLAMLLCVISYVSVACAVAATGMTAYAHIIHKRDVENVRRELEELRRRLS